MPSNRRTHGAAQYHLTQEEREQLHAALFSRALKEVTEGSVKDAVIAVDLLERVQDEKDTGELLAWLKGDN